MRLVMLYKWQGIAGGSRGKILKASSSNNGTVYTVKFDYGETREVPMAATIQETVYNNRNLEPIL